MRYAARKDANHNVIAEYLQRNGWSVFDLSAYGRNLPDLLVARAGFTALVEIKDGDKSPSKRRLSAGQREFIEGWQGAVIVGETPEQTLADLNRARNAL